MKMVYTTLGTFLKKSDAVKYTENLNKRFKSVRFYVQKNEKKYHARKLTR